MAAPGRPTPRAPEIIIKNEFRKGFIDIDVFEHLGPPFQGRSTMRVADTATFPSPMSIKPMRNSLFVCNFLFSCAL